MSVNQYTYDPVGSKDVEVGDLQKKEDNKFVYATAVKESSPSSNYWGRFNIPDAGYAIPVSTTEDAGDSVPWASATIDVRSTRVAFIRKVYTILIAQLLVSFVTCAVMALHRSTRDFVLSSTGSGLMSVNFVVQIATVFALYCYKRSYPTNYILLSIFTLSSSYMIGFISAVYALEGAGDLILEAVGITATVFIVLTVYTLNSKHDFSFLGAGLGMGVMVIFLWGLAAIIFGIHAGFVYGLLGSLLFSGFVIYDTYIMAERHDPEDYVIAAIELYLDIINLFLFILRMLNSNRSN